MLVSCSLFALGLLSLVSGEFPFQGCATRCDLIAFQEQITSARDLLTQSEAYAKQWRSDCSSCTERRQSYLNAAVAYLDASSLDLELDGPARKSSSAPSKPFMEKAAKAACPSWKELSSQYKSLLSTLFMISRILKVYQSSCSPVPALCDRWNARLLELSVQFTEDNLSLLDTLLYDCWFADCDVSAQCLSDWKGCECKISCDPYNISQHWLEVAQYETSKAVEFFLKARPSDCDECCDLRKSFAFGASNHFLVARYFASFAGYLPFADFLPKSQTIQRRPRRITRPAMNKIGPYSSCSEAAEWEADYVFLLSASSIIDGIKGATCAGYKCPDTYEIEPEDGPPIPPAIDSLLNSLAAIDVYVYKFATYVCLDFSGKGIKG